MRRRSRLLAGAALVGAALAGQAAAPAEGAQAAQASQGPAARGAMARGETARGATAQGATTPGATARAATARGAGRLAASALPAICHPGLGLASCYTMTLTTSGAVTLRGSSSMPEDARCDRYLSSVAGGGTEVPLPTLSVNDYKDELTVNLEGWKGPGTYPLAKRLNEGTASYASVSLTVGSTKTYGTLEAGAKPATGSAVVRSDGSVTVTFKGLAAYGHASKTVSGTAKYSCQDI